MKRVIYLSCFLGACNMPASDSNALTPDSARYDYQIVGGKQGALVEQLQIDCTAKQAILSRETQEKTAVYRHVAAVSAEQCTTLASLAAPLCMEAEADKQQIDVFDAAGYTLTCSSGDLPAVSFNWQGTLRAAPDCLRPWHDYTRSLIGSAFPGVNTYP